MIRKDVKNTLIFNELTEEFQKDYFSYSDKKFIHNIDTFYYSVFIENDNTDLENIPSVKSLIDSILIKKENVVKNNNEVYYYEDIQLLVTRKRFSIYECCLSINNFFDIFISSYIPNENTPRIVIQLRSIGLWLNGVENLIDNSFSVVERLLSDFNLKVKKVQENRIDYCYHTNYIQNPDKYFSDDILRNNLNTTFSIYSKVGRKNNKELTVEYLSLGKRTSNNVFFRSYNKTREVIEMNYKCFFIDYWYKNKLISFYDKFILEYAYQKGNYEAVEWAKLEFYLKYGQDQQIKENINLLKQDYSTNLDAIRNYIKTTKLVPDITLIMNIEFQTMRKFYYYSDDLISGLDTKNCNNNLLTKLYQIIDNRKLFLDYLTQNTVVFIKNDKVIDWWNRLSNLKLSCNSNYEFSRDYSRKLDIDKLKQRLKGTIASMNMYLGNDDTSLTQDMSSVLCVLNDNDVKNEEVVFVNNGTGEILDINDCDYRYIKEKKKKSLGSLLKKAKAPKELI